MEQEDYLYAHILKRAKSKAIAMKTLLVSFAIAAFFLVNISAHDIANAGQFKPVIKKPVFKKPRIVIRPDVTPQTKKMINKETSNAVTEAAKKPTGNGVPEAGPQPEPPTLPAQSVGQASSTPSLPRSRPYNEFEEDGVGGDIDVADALPPELGAPPALEELFDTTGGNLNDLRDVASLLKDGLEGQNARPDLAGADGEDFPGAFGGNLLPGGDRIGAWKPLDARGEARLGPDGSNDGFGVDMMAGIPRSPASTAPGPGGSASSDGWTKQPTRTRGQTVWHRDVRSADGEVLGWDTFTRTDNVDGSSSGVLTIYSNDGGLISRTVNVVGAPNKSGIRLVTITVGDDTDNPETSELETKYQGGPSPDDQDGDGVPDDTGGTQAGQPIPDGGGAASGLCAGWNPANGCGRPSLKIWETTGQPDPSGDGTATTRSAGASIGPEAVTNADEFHSGSGGGGVRIDPCIAAGDDCGNGPDDPTASMEGVPTAGN